MAVGFGMGHGGRGRRACAVRLSDGSVVAAKVAGTPLSRLRGLLGRKPPCLPLLITRCHDIHTFGMQAPIDVAFLDGEGEVVKVERALAPGNRMFASALGRDGAACVLERFSDGGPWVEKGTYPLI